MAINLIQSSFTDIYGNVTNDFKANAGDLIKVEHTYTSEISAITSTTNKFRIDKLENKLSRTEGSFLNDGFRTGQTYSLVLVTITNSIQNNWTGTILSVSDLFITMTGLPNLNQGVSTDYVGFILAVATHDSLNFAFNFVDNDIPKENSPSLDSLIDQESSRFNVNGLNSLTIGNSLDLVQVGKQSGQFSISSATIERLADINNPYTAFTSVRRQYKVTLYVIFNGMFATNSFVGVKCLKYYSKSSFKILATENLAPTVIEFNEKANTGLWNEGFNEDQANSTSSTTIDNIYYNKQNTFTITAKCPTSLGITSVEIGAMYLTVDDSFNKNKQQPQDYFLPFLKTGLFGVADIGNDWLSTTTSPFNIVLEDFSYIDAGGERFFTIEISMNTFYASPNGFGKFIESRGELDRNFLLWLKVGNTNLNLYDADLIYEQPVGVEFTSVSNFINHDNNIDYKNLNNVNLYSNSDFNIEDDIAYISEFSLFTYDVNQSITASVVVKNNDNNDEFVLDKVFFDISTQDLGNFINQTVPSVNNLPDSSNKKDCFLFERSALSVNEMEVRLFYPFLIDWRYWEEVMKTNAFFISKNKNNSDWTNYNINPYQIFVKIEIKRNNVVDYNYTPLLIKNYDEWEGTSTIELYDKSETKLYNNIQQGTIMLIKATHIFPQFYADFPYGMITIEPSESSPRFILSTEIQRKQANNPLIGISDINLCDIEYVDSTTIILRCYVNTNLLNGKNFCISSKISDEGQQNINPEENKITEDGTDKITEDGSNVKIIE
jgi:hypothetical protein